MMIKWLTLSALILTTPSLLSAKQAPVAELPKAKKEPPPQPYDADLFRKDAQVYGGHAELLVWAVSEGALDYALQMQQLPQGAATYYAQGDFASGTYNVDPGVRVALTYFRAAHYWEVKWQYTRFTAVGNDSVEPINNAYLNGTWPQIVPNPLNKATSHLHLNYNVFDWTGARVFIPNPHLRMKVIGGVFMAWLDQFWKVRYVDTANNGVTTTNRWSYMGGGLKIGGSLDWFWTGELYATAAANCGLLVGSYSNLAQQQTNVTVMNANLYDTRGVFTTQMLFGPSWQRNFKNSRMELFAGFETNLWFNLQEIYRSSGSVSPTAGQQTIMNTGMLALYGLTLRLSGDF